MFDVNGKSFDNLVDAVSEAKSSKARCQITTHFKDGQCGYQGYSRVVASFNNGVDIDSLATDEDGNPDYGVRATAY